MRRIVVFVGLTVLGAWMVLSQSVFAAPAAAGSLTWQAHVGAQTDDKALQALAFFPNDVFVNVGDSITWSFDTAEVHTVSFVPPGATAPGANAGITPDHSSFDGSQVINSGVKIGPATYTINFTGTGDFNYLCLIHAKTMISRVHVNPAGSAYPRSQAEYDRQARAQSRLLLDDGKDIREDSRDTARRDNVVVTGGGEAQVFVARFLPDTKRINVGDTVMWTNPDSITPHTVTFGSPSATPVGLDSAGHATISANPPGNISSGLIGIRRPLGSNFAVTFNAPGTYTYFCTLHGDLGMTGTIVVRGKDDDD